MATAVAARPGRAHGEEVPPTPPLALTQAEFLARVRAHDLTAARAEARVDVLRAEGTAARALPNPALDLGREEVFGSGAGASEHAVTLAWPIDVSGRRARRARAVDANVAAAGAELELVQTLRELDALEAYWHAAFARERLALLQEGRRALAGVVAIVRDRAAGGEAAPFDAERLALELGLYDDVFTSTSIELDASRRTLARLCGASDEVFDAADPLDPHESVDAAAAVGLRGDRRAAELRIEAADAERSAAERGWVPPLVVTGGLKTAEGGGSHAVGYVAGVSVELPLFDRRQADAERAEAERRVAEAEVRLLERESAAEVRAARMTLQARAAQATAFAATQVARLPELLRRAEALYREGERPIFELLDSYRTARDVRLRALELRHARKRAELDLARALGRRP